MHAWRGHRRPQAAAWLLVLALLQAQALGLWHRVAHGGGAVVAAAPAADRGQAHDHAPFGHDAGDEAQCRLYDGIGGAALAAACPALPPVHAVPEVAPTPVLQRLAELPLRPYQARAPPRG